MRVIWSARAQRDLDAIYAYVARDTALAARNWITKLRQRARAVAAVPKVGRLVPEFEKLDVREVFVGSYRIVYQIEANCVRVLTVFEGHRLIPDSVVQDP